MRPVWHGPRFADGGAEIRLSGLQGYWAGRGDVDQGGRHSTGECRAGGPPVGNTYAAQELCGGALWGFWDQGCSEGTVTGWSSRPIGRRQAGLTTLSSASGWEEGFKVAAKQPEMRQKIAFESSQVALGQKEKVGKS